MSWETDVADTWEQARAMPIPPLVVRDGLRDALGLETLPRVRRIDAGHSNPTFRVQAEGEELILRRPPRPPFAPGAHDVMREHRVLVGLSPLPVRAPMPVLGVSDVRAIGAPFYVMEAIDGMVLRDRVDGSLATPLQRQRAAADAVLALTELHRVDPEMAALGSRARGADYLDRQVALWSGQWERLNTRAIGALDEVARRLRWDVPRPQRVSVVHGDYKLDNLLFAHDAPAQLLAILDWEMATVGDPLADVGYLTATWTDAGEDPERLGRLSAATVATGFPGRRDLAEQYAHLTDLSLDRLSWYQALALWKLAILLEASYARYVAGTASDPFFATLEDVVPAIAEEALAASQGWLL